MEKWFGPWSDEPFYTFGTSHLIMLTIFLIGLGAVAFSSKWLLRHDKAYQFIRYLLLTLLFVSEVSYQTWAAINGLWNFSDHMPLHLCGIASLFGMLSLLTYHPKLIKVNFFIGIIPAFVALITPDLPFDYQHYRFWKFFLHHMAIPWTCLFLVLTTTVRITWVSMVKSYLFLVIYAIVISFVNTMLASNYLYLNHPPIAGTPLDYLGEGTWYIINLGLLALVVFAVMLGVYKAVEKFIEP